jgi:hypothetical protein
MHELEHGYPFGVSAPLDWSSVNRRERAEIAGWADFVYNGPYWTARPLLRDVFEMNLISCRQTEVSVGDIGRLNEWIEARAGRGHLEDLGEGRLLWTLDEAEIVRVRPELDRNGWLASCYPRVYRGLGRTDRFAQPATDEVTIN